MQIYYISYSMIHSRSASSIHVMKMCQAFALNGHKIELYANRSSKKEKDIFNYYGVEKCFKISKYLIPRIQGTSKLPDLFYGRYAKGLLEMTSSGKPIIFEVHAPPKNEKEKKIQEALISHKNFKHLVSISHTLKNEYLNLFPCLKNKVIVAPDGADPPKSLNNQNRIFKLMGKSKKKFNIGYIGHLYPGKSMEIILELAKRLPDYDFHIVGGTNKDLKYWKNNISIPNIIFYGFVPNSQLGKYYNAFDIVLAPYQHKVSGFDGGGNLGQWMSPLKIFEYMAYSKAIIASNLPVLREILFNRKNSLLCSPDDITEWIKAILELENDTNLRNKLAKTGNTEFMKYYTWQKRAEKVIQ